MMTTTDHATLMTAQARANELFEWLMAAPPSEHETVVRERYPSMPRERVVRVVVREMLAREGEKTMPRMIECRDMKPGMESTRTLLREETREDGYGNRRKWQLWHKTTGYECAGSAMRLVPRECWGVITRIDGATCGAWVRTLAEAEELLVSKGSVA